MDRKLYPKVKTNDWLKFTFKHNWEQFTIRFAGKPLYLLERLYEKAWWKDFEVIYNKAKNGEQIWDEEYVALNSAIIMCETILSVFADIERPLVVYVRDVE